MDTSTLQGFDRNWDGREPKEGEPLPTAYRYIVLVRVRSFQLLDFAVGGDADSLTPCDLESTNLMTRVRVLMHRCGTGIITPKGKLMRSSV